MKKYEQNENSCSLKLNGKVINCKINRNLTVDQLIHIIIEKNEGIITDNQSISVTTGEYTGRSPNDRYIVCDDQTHDTIAWGKMNNKFTPKDFDNIFSKMMKFIDGKELFIFDGFIGADKAIRTSIRVISDHAWQSLFVRQLFIRPDTIELLSHVPEFTILCINDFYSDPIICNTRSNVFILINISLKLVLIGGTSYAGEIKKAMFSIMNYILPPKNILPMHCSANIGSNGDTTLFFGLSGTGKTSLSADPSRSLIGDDEHGWSDNGIFNFEGGCYAKCIRLDKNKEPQIWNAIKKGTILENVIVDPHTLHPDFEDSSLTENTRAAYPLNYIHGSKSPSVGNHPNVILFLTADALGVLPPISKLTKNGAMFHFMSGYTSKLAGTERGIKEPKAVFSECFGAPFMPRSAHVYAKMLGDLIIKHNTKVYLVNTGWTMGPYGIGKRINISYSRSMVSAALDGSIDNSGYKYNELFNLYTPIQCNCVPSKILNPRNTWEDKNSYDKTANKLAQMFVDNFKKFDNVEKQISNAGPNVYNNQN
ncbi:MAG: phosphoenolpyruvate carboxykinase (ATP) [Thaumarchaeota archaeon]|nr:phosphoenolpyruvate carboxykinase (ATP) [Nitrososphaerota archaeon]MCY3976185.1 phosphoenolpyruvate carboxykinase (ATP) [Nitrososphaerota archaeon]